MAKPGPKPRKDIKDKRKNKYRAEVRHPVTGETEYIKRYPTQAARNRAQENRMREILGEIEFGEKQDLPFKYLCHEYLSHLEGRKSYNQVRYVVLEWIREWKLGEHWASEITPNMIQRHLNKKRQAQATSRGKRKKGGESAAHMHHQYLKAMCNWGLKQKLITNDFVSGVTTTNPKPKRKQKLTVEMVNRLHEACDRQEDKDYFQMMRNLGCRAIELNRMKFEDIFWKEGEAELYNRKNKGSLLKARTIPMNKIVRGILDKRYKEWEKTGRELNPEGFVFFNRNTMDRYKSRQPLMHSLCKKCGLVDSKGQHLFTLHRLRSHFITELANNAGKGDYSLEDVRILAGHVNIATTQGYITTDRQAQQRAVDLIGKLSQQPTEKRSNLISFRKK